MISVGIDFDSIMMGQPLMSFEPAIDARGEMWQELEMLHPGNPKAQLEAWIDQVAEHIRLCDEDCMLANSALRPGACDHSAKAMIREAKQSYRAALARLCAEAGLSEPDIAADMLVLLEDGALASRSDTAFKQVAEATLRRHES